MQHPLHVAPRRTAPKALLFDVFGTVVDWRSTVTARLHAAAQQALHQPDSSAPVPAAVRARAAALSAADWGRFAQAWRDSYMHFTLTFDPATSAWTDIDTHNLHSLQGLLDDWRLQGLFSDARVTALSRVWHALAAWPDARPGLAGLPTVTATLSNGNVALLADLAAHAHLPFTHLLSAELFRAYKPNPIVYNGAVEKLGLRPDECAMVAAHLGDLQAARACGLQTIYVERPGEETWAVEKIKQAKTDGWVDMWVGMGEGEQGFLTVAERLGIGSQEEDRGG